MTLQEIINKSNNIVFFGGAGVSTESGMPDFRSVDGLYNQKYDYPPETILSHTFFMNNTSEFFRFYRDKLIVKNVKPNKAHVTLEKLEKAGKLKAVITQNIDGLHQAAGSRNVLELHGSVLRNFCMDCNRAYGLETVEKSVDIPKCECGGIIKPNVVLYEEMLDDSIISKSVKYISEADTLIIGGTSLNVYPAAGFINYFNGQHLVIINKASTPADKKADLVINEPIGEVLGRLEL
ncbi:MAG: NAD-dependent protein deacylase [Clostridia bacterium]|nr:NAD-dependent protein deacylase [Clostridia bacterium]